MVHHFIRKLFSPRRPSRTINLRNLKQSGNDPGSLFIREAGKKDIAPIAGLHVKTFNETHAPIFHDGPVFETRERQWKELFEKGDGDWFCFVIENAQQELVGFATGQLYTHSELPDFAGELNKIYLLRKYQRLGLGRKLICAVAQRFLDKGISSMLLFGEAHNPSNRFYEALGAEKLFAANGEFHGGYGWRELKGLIGRCG